MALLDDVGHDEGLTMASRMSIRRAGLVERWYASGLSRTTRAPEQRLRAGSITVLASWALMMVAGASIAKASEHFEAALPASQRTYAQVAIDVVRVSGLLGATVVIVGALMCVPAFVRFLREGRSSP